MGGSLVERTRGIYQITHHGDASRGSAARLTEQAEITRKMSMHQFSKYSKPSLHRPPIGATSNGPFRGLSV